MHPQSNVIWPQMHTVTSATWRDSFVPALKQTRLGMLRASKHISAAKSNAIQHFVNGFYFVRLDLVSVLL